MKRGLFDQAYCPNGMLLLSLQMGKFIFRRFLTSTIKMKGQGHTIDGDSKSGYVLKISKRKNADPTDPCPGGNLTLNNATITGGNHDHFPGNGGGIVNGCAGVLTLNDVMVSGNTAQGNGGGVFNSSNGKVTLNNSTINGNIAGGDGGGIYTDLRQVGPAVYSKIRITLNNSTISGNTARENGGGICSYDGKFIITNSTIVENTEEGSDGGGGIYFNSTKTWYPRLHPRKEFGLTGSIISGNTAPIGNELVEIVVNGAESINTDNFNLNLFGESGENNSQAFVNFTPSDNDIIATSDCDPIGNNCANALLSDIIRPLSDNGGQTLTHALVPGSPAIDLDMGTECSTGLTRDQRSSIRPDGEGCDAGSFEYSYAEIIVDADDICTLADAITAANTDTSTGGCPAGSGHDTILLETDVLLAAALPDITSTITIEAQGHVIDGNGVDWSVLTISNEGNLILNQGTVTGANNVTGHIYGYGGGIYNDGTVTLNNFTINGNTALSKGGGIYNTAIANLTLNSSTVSKNTAGSGGGICTQEGKVTLNNSTVSENTASSGGGIDSASGDLAGPGTVTLIGSTIRGNTASDSDSYSWGAGILNTNTLILINSTVTENIGKAGAAGIDNWGICILRNSTVSGNSVRTGGIVNEYKVTLINSTISGNSASHFSFAGGITNLPMEVDVELTMEGSIISGNTAPEHNEFINTYRHPSHALVTADNFNLFGHSGESNSQAFKNFTPGANDVTATSDGTNPTSLSNILKPLANNGGSTLTHALVPGSPAIDLDVNCDTGVAKDQRGQSRPVGNGCDAGSFEFTTTPKVPRTGTDKLPNLLQPKFMPFIHILLLSE